MDHPTRLQTALVTSALLATVAGCDGSDTASAPVAAATRHAPCKVGERPDYFVPGRDAGDPLAIMGRAGSG
jgi:hypothetical protein